MQKQAKEATGVDPAGLIELIVTTSCVVYNGGGGRARKNDYQPKSDRRTVGNRSVM